IGLSSTPGSTTISCGRYDFISCSGRPAIEHGKYLLHLIAVDCARRIGREPPQMLLARRLDFHADAAAFESRRNVDGNSARQLEIANAAMNFVFDAGQTREAQPPEFLLQPFKLVVPAEPRVGNDAGQFFL